MKKIAPPLLAATALVPTALLALATATSPLLAAGLPRVHAGTADDPIPIRFGESRNGVLPPGSQFGPAWKGDFRWKHGVRAIPWLDAMTARFPIESSVVFTLKAAESGQVLIEARSLDFDPALRFSRVMPDGEVIPLEFGDGSTLWRDCYRVCGQIRPVLRAGDTYRIEVFAAVTADWPTEGGEFSLAVGPERPHPEQPPLWQIHLDQARRAEERARTHGNSARQLTTLIRRIALIWDATEDEEALRPLLARAEALLERDPYLIPRGRHPDIVKKLRMLFDQGRLEVPPEQAGLDEQEEKDYWIAFWQAHEDRARRSGDDRFPWRLRYAQARMGLWEARATPVDKRDYERLERLEKNLFEAFDRLDAQDDLRLAKTLGIATWHAGLLGDDPEAGDFILDKGRALKERGLQIMVRLWDSLEASMARAEYPAGISRTLIERSSSFRWTRRLGFLEDEETGKAHTLRALSLAQETFGPGDARVAETLVHASDEGWGELGVGEPASAFQVIHEMLREVYGTRHPRLAWPGSPVWLKGVRLRLQGRAEEWLAYMRELLDRRLDLWGPMADQVNGQLHHVARALWESGRLAEARRAYEEFMPRTERKLGWRTEPWTWVAGELARIYVEMGSYEQARALAERAREVSDALNIWGDAAYHFRAALVEALIRLGQPDEALEVAQSSPSLLEREHYEASDYWVARYYLAVGLWMTAQAQLARGEPEEAGRLYGEALSAVEPYDNLKIRNIRSWILREYSRFLWEQGLSGQARPLVEQALEYQTAIWGEERVHSGDILITRAGILADLEDPGALESALEAEATWTRHVRMTSRTLSESHAISLAMRPAGGAAVRSPLTGLNVALSLLAAGRQAGGSELSSVHDAAIRSRALVLDEISSRNRFLSGFADPEVAALAARFHAASRRTANLLARSGAMEALRDSRPAIEAAIRESQAAEEALATASAAFRGEREMRKAGLAEVRRALPPGGVLLSYKRFDRIRFPSPVVEASLQAASESPAAPGSSEWEERTAPHYAAFVYRAGAEQPAFVPLGDAGTIDAAVSVWKQALVEGRSFHDAGAELRMLIWDPVATHVGEAERVFIVPDGTLNLVAFAALPDGDGGWLVESGPVLHYLSAERDLVRAAQEEEPEGTDPERAAPRRGSTLLAMGGADFDTGAVFAALRPGGDATGEPTAAVASAAVPPDGSVSAPASASAGSGLSFAGDAAARIPVVSAFRGERSGCGAFGEHSFAALPHTGREIEEIAALWTTAGAAGDDPRGGLTLLGSDATESAFKARVHGSSIVHLATHGFFLGGECISALEPTRGFGAVKTAEAASSEPGAPAAAPPGIGEGDASPALASIQGENPLILSGLALAGANNREHAGEDEDDGILTAQEIAAMDLSGVEWAVLSACDTGVGEIRAGEGVFGLRRAFQVAGADTLIMSLWSVEDEATRAWMKALYEGRLKKGLDTAAAVRHASLTVLNDRRDRGLSDHPFYWAAFVAAGDWR